MRGRSLNASHQHSELNGMTPYDFLSRYENTPAPQKSLAAWQGLAHDHDHERRNRCACGDSALS